MKNRNYLTLADIIKSQETREYVRPFARAAKSTAKGIASIGDLANLPVNAALGFAGYQPLPSPSNQVGEWFDERTNGLTAPRNTFERVTDTAGEFVAGGVPFTGIARTVPLASNLAPNSLKELINYGAAGAGSETFNQAFPENHFAPTIGALAGATAIPAAGKIAASATPKRFAEKNLSGIDLKEAVDNKYAANRLGFEVTPAEASGNPFVAANQGKLGSSSKGAQSLYAFGNERRPRQVNAIESFYENVAPKPSGTLSPDQLVRNAANNIIQEEKNSLIAKAQPYYAKAESQLLPEKIFKDLLNQDGNIEKALKAVMKDPLYKGEIQGFKPNSTKVLDLSKRYIDDQIATAMRQGESNKVRILGASKNRLLEQLDAANPDYKKARSIYTEGSPEVRAIEESPLGKIAARKDLTIKNIGKDIFDRQQTNPKVFSDLKSRISNEDPATWNAIVRQELERRAGSSSKGGSNFYKKVLTDDTSFKQFYEALEGNKSAQGKLEDMRKAFKNLIEPVSAKTAAGQAKSSLNVPRSSFQAVKNLADNVLGGKYDKAAIELILDPKWDKRLAQIQKSISPQAKAEKLESLLRTANQQLINKQQDTSIFKEEVLDIDYESMPIEELRALVEREEDELDYENMPLDELRALVEADEKTPAIDEYLFNKNKNSATF